MANEVIIESAAMDRNIVQCLVILVMISGVSPTLNSTRMSEILHSYSEQRLNLAPRNEGETVKVQVAVYILNMVPLNFINEHIYVEINLFVKWLDNRLSFHNTSESDVLTLQGEATEFFWRPDIFFDGEKGVKHDTFPGKQTSALIFPDGHVLYSTRLSVTVYCPMKFKMFPFDKQACSLRIESWSFNVNSLTLEYLNRTDQPSVWFSSSFHLSKFLLEKFETVKHSLDYGVSGVFDQLEVIFYMKRDIRYYLMEYFFPTICLVLLSFVSFWIHFKATPARVSLPVTTFLTLTKTVAHVRENADIYGNAHALEIFLNVSVVFVFGVIFQYGLVEVTAKSWAKKYLKRKMDGTENEAGERLNRRTLGLFSKTNAFLMRKHRRMQHEVHLLDKISRYLFPLSYIVFVLIYGISSFLHLSR